MECEPRPEDIVLALAKLKVECVRIDSPIYVVIYTRQHHEREANMSKRFDINLMLRDTVHDRHGFLVHQQVAPFLKVCFREHGRKP